MASTDEIFVLPGNRFSSFLMENLGSGEPRLQILAKVDADGHLTGDWRAVLGSLCPVNYSISAAQIYQTSQLAGKKIIFLKSWNNFRSKISF
jgi:hypothetical protein